MTTLDSNSRRMTDGFDARRIRFSASDGTFPEGRQAECPGSTFEPRELSQGLTFNVHRQGSKEQCQVRTKGNN